MAQAQAFVQTCIDFRIQPLLQKYFEDTLNLYAVDFKTDMGGVKEIFDATPQREWIFKNMQVAVDKHAIERIILINHTDCAAYGGSDNFPSLEEEIHTHEIQLRHAVSAVKTQFPEMTVEAYLVVLGQLSDPTTVRKVI